MQLEPGMRVRCVDAEWHTMLTNGAEYVVRSGQKCRIGGTHVYIEGHAFAYYARRFKPVIRVKARSQWVNSDLSFLYAPTPATHIFAGAH